MKLKTSSIGGSGQGDQSILAHQGIGGPVTSSQSSAWLDNFETTTLCRNSQNTLAIALLVACHPKAQEDI